MKLSSPLTIAVFALLATSPAHQASAARLARTKARVVRTKRSPDHRAVVTRARRATRARTRADAQTPSPEATQATIDSLRAGSQAKLDRARRIEDRAINGESENLPLDAAVAEELRSQAAKMELEATHLAFKLTKRTTGRYLNPLARRGESEIFYEGPELEKAYQRKLSEWEDSSEWRDEKTLEASSLRMTPRTRARTHWSLLSSALTAPERRIDMDGPGGAWSFNRSPVAEPKLVDHFNEPLAGNTITYRRFKVKPTVHTGSRLSGWRSGSDLDGWKNTGSDRDQNGANRGVPELKATFGPHLERAFAGLGGRDAVIDVGTGAGNIADEAIGGGTGARVIGVDLVDNGGGRKATSAPRYSFVKGNIRSARVRREVRARSKGLKRKVLIDAFGPVSWDQRPDQVLASYGELLDVGGQAFIQLPPPGRYWVYPASGRGRPTEYGDYLLDKLEAASGWKIDFAGFVEREKRTGNRVSSRVVVLTRTEGPATVPAKLSPLAASSYQPSSTFRIPMLPRAWIEAN